MNINLGYIYLRGINVHGGVFLLLLVDVYICLLLFLLFHKLPLRTLVCSISVGAQFFGQMTVSPP